MRHIKRYSNRKLYDTLVCHYTTLAQIAVEIRAGDEIQVTMHQTGADITSQILAQVIYTEILKGRTNLSVATLREIICEGLRPEGPRPEGTHEVSLATPDGDL